jgi:hypothetical protein
MGRGADNAPEKFYIASERPGRREPPEVTAARKRAQALSADIEKAQAALEARLDELAAARRDEPDVGPGWELYRERAAEDADDLTGLAGDWLP